MIICLKGISEECLSFNVNVNAGLSSFEYSEGSRKSLREPLFTWAFGHLRHSSTYDTRALKAFRHLVLKALVALHLADSFNSNSH